jgi:hypothetical protein
MSKTKSNVHPGQYKIAGRERQGEDVMHERERAKLTQVRAQLEQQERYPAPPAPNEESRMPERETIERARRDEAEGASPSTQAGEFVREEIHHIREGKHGARSTKQAIAIGLSKARRAGVKLGAPKRGSKSTRQKAARDAAKGRRHPGRKPSPTRSRAVKKALKREGRSAATRGALARQARSTAFRRTAAQRSKAARKAARTRARRG